MTFDRSTPPEPGPIRPFDFPAVDADRIAGGLALRTARRPQVPVVAFSLVLPAGESVAPPERAGVAVLAGDALEGGTGRRSGTELAEALEGIGADLSVGTGWDATTVSLSCMADRKEEALAILAEVVLDPAFPDDEVERSRDQRLARIRQRAMTPSALASDRASALFYADGVPYGRPLAGVEETVAPLDADALRAFVDARYRPEDAGLVVVGDVDVGEIAGLVEEHFAGWSGAAASAPPVDALPRTRRRLVHVIDRPGSVQSEIRVGHPGAPKTTDDYHALVVANVVLGGAFTSRLNMNLRERHGFTYGVRSRFAFRRSAGPFRVSTAVASDVTAPAVREIVSELDALVTGGLTDDEVSAARDYVAGVFPLRLETSGQLADRIAELLVYGLPDDWHARYRESIRGVEREGAEEAARRWIRPDEAQVVVVGDADEIVGPLEGLGLGPVTVHG